MTTVADRPVPASLPLARSSILFKVAAEPTMVIASGPRALLLQVAHPLVAAGVAEHSDFESRPWSRLLRTVAVVTAIAFSDPARSDKAARRLRHTHAAVTGVAGDGTPYRALDPELLLWVWATLGDSLVRVHETFVGSLSRHDKDELYEQWKLVGYACGIPAGGCPETWDRFGAYFDAMVSDSLVPTEVAQTVSRYVRRPPVPFPLDRLAGGVLEILTAGQLPAALREQLGFEWDLRRQVAFDLCSAAARTAARVTPGWARRAPMVLASSSVQR